MVNFNEEAKVLQSSIVKDRRELHQIPEIGFDLPKTSAYVKKRLSEMDIAYRDCGKISEETVEKYVSAGYPKQDKVTGIVATIGSGSPCILLRADMDALPMPEPANVEYASKHCGFMHSCGHDGHTSILLGAAKILKDNESKLKGTVKLMFQVGEEFGIGSKLMIDDGLLENPKVDAAFAIHLMPDQRAGTVNYSTGVTSSSFDSWNLLIQGKGGHSSMPQNTIDPNVIAAQLFTQLDLLAGREADPAANVSFVVGEISGGYAANIIPDTALMKFGMRTLNREARNHLVERVPEIVEHMITMWRGTYHLTAFSTPSTFNDEKLAHELTPIIESVLGKENVSLSNGFPASEDFGYVSEKVPGLFVIMGAGEVGAHPVHNPNMVLDESVFYLGSSLHATIAMKWLENNSK